MAAETLYIVIPVHSRGSFDTRDCFTKCVATLEQHTSNFRLIFVDDFSDDLGSESIRKTAARFASSYIIRTEKQRWFTRAVNLGLRLVRSPWCITLNSDCELGAGWLEEMLAVRDEVSKTQKVGLVGSTLSGDEQRRYDLTSFPNYVTGHCWLLNMQALYECSAARGMPGFYLDEQRQDAAHIRSDNFICHQMNGLGYATVRSFKSAVGHVAGGRSWGHDLRRISSLRLEDLND